MGTITKSSNKRTKNKKDIEGFIGRGYYVIKSSKINILLFIPDDNISRIISYLNNYVVDDYLIRGEFILNKVELNKVRLGNNSTSINSSNNTSINNIECELLYIRYSLDNIPLNHILFKLDSIYSYLYINNCKYEYQTIKTNNKYFFSNKENYILKTTSNNILNNNTINSDYDLYFKFLTYKIRSNYNLIDLFNIILSILNNKNKFNYSFYNLINYNL